MSFCLFPTLERIPYANHVHWNIKGIPCSRSVPNAVVLRFTDQPGTVHAGKQQPPFFIFPRGIEPSGSDEGNASGTVAGTQSGSRNNFPLMLKTTRRIFLFFFQTANVENSGRGPSPTPRSLSPGSPLQAAPAVLVQSQIARLAKVAENLLKSLPQFEPKPHNAKKKICKDLEVCAQFQIANSEGSSSQVIKRISNLNQTKCSK